MRDCKLCVPKSYISTRLRLMVDEQILSLLRHRDVNYYRLNPRKTLSISSNSGRLLHLRIFNVDKLTFFCRDASISHIC